MSADWTRLAKSPAVIGRCVHVRGPARYEVGAPAAVWGCRFGGVRLRGGRALGRVHTQNKATHARHALADVVVLSLLSLSGSRCRPRRGFRDVCGLAVILSAARATDHVPRWRPGGEGSSTRLSTPRQGHGAAPKASVGSRSVRIVERVTGSRCTVSSGSESSGPPAAICRASRCRRPVGLTVVPPLAPARCGTQTSSPQHVRR